MKWFDKRNKKSSDISTNNANEKTSISVNDPNDASEYKKFENEFTEDGFWNKLKQLTSNASSEIIKKALVLYYLKDYCDIKNKAILFGSLGYLILPFDMIADIIPVLGFADDLAALTAVFTLLESVYQKNKVRIDEKVDAKLHELLK